MSEARNDSQFSKRHVRGSSSPHESSSSSKSRQSATLIDFHQEPGDLEGPEALNYIFRLHRSELLRFSRTRIGNSDDAEDLVQEAFISAGRAYSDKPIEELRPLLFTILRNLTRDYLKSGYTRNWRDSADIGELGDRLACCQTMTPEQQVQDAQLLSMAETAIAGLKSRERQALQLHRLEGLTHEAIATRLSVSPRTVRSDIAAALAAIAKVLSHSGGWRPDAAE
jgi:RNA polymerase sigma factor (sigma-70 family)